jgi:hypothetical protein
MLGLSAVCWALWTARNRTFLRKNILITLVRSYFEHVCLWILGQICIQMIHRR